MMASNILWSGLLVHSSTKSIFLLLTLVITLLLASLSEGKEETTTTTVIPMDTRVILPRGPHLKSLSYGSGGVLTGEWDGLSRSPSLAIQLVAGDGTDMKPFELDLDDRIDVVVVLRGRGTEVATSYCSGETFICPVSLAALQVSGMYELAVRVQWTSSQIEGQVPLFKRHLPERKVNLVLSHSRQVSSLSFMRLPPYMLSGSFYSWTAHLMDTTFASLAGVLTPYEGLEVEVDAWLGHRRYPAAKGIVSNSSVLFSHVFVNLSETQSVMLVARLGTVQSEPQSLTIHKCPTNPGDRRKLLEVKTTSSKVPGRLPPLLHHAESFSVRIAVAQPSVATPHPKIPQYLCRLGQDEGSLGSLALQAKLFKTKSYREGRGTQGTSALATQDAVTAVGRTVDPCSVVCDFPPFATDIPVVSSYLSVLENSRRGFSRSSISNITRVHFSGYSEV